MEIETFGGLIEKLNSPADLGVNCLWFKIDWYSQV